MTECVTTYVTRLNVNKICLLIKVVYDTAQVLSVNTDNTKECLMSRKHKCRMLPLLVVMKNCKYKLAHCNLYTYYRIYANLVRHRI